MQRVIRDSANILIQVETDDLDKIYKIIKICEKLDYDIIFLMLRNYKKYMKILENTNVLVLRKIIVTGSKNIPKDYDMVSARSINRFVLNKLIRVEEIDSIVVDVENRDEVPSKDQLKIMKREGKSIEVILKLDKLLDFKYLRFLETFLDMCMRCGIIFFFYIPVKDISDLKNPYDVYSIVEVLCNVDSKFIRELRVRQLQFVSDMFYRKGLEIQLSS
ncbi:MAG: hypothetical protein GXO10_00650 [Crenarchaeota archaeon]|nr:hypothetical protein [Thermoproteota archaeon]